MPRSNLTRRFYEQAPYPPPRHAVSKTWRLAPLDWMFSIDRERRSTPKRVLVAGCGTGSEAFLLQDVLGDAEVTGIDFSPRSIRIAKATRAKTARLKRVRFVTADLSHPTFARRVGGDFDLIVCHGVLSYIAQPLVALRNLRRCLRPEGLLYLGVNGAGHFSARLRLVMRTLGMDVAEIPADERWRELIKMWEATGEGTSRGPPSRLPRWYLGGDFFGPVIHNLPVHEWRALFSRAGLFLRGSLTAHRALRPVVTCEATALLMPRSRADLCEVLDRMHPQGFHRLVVTCQPTPNPPWKNRSRLLSWRPAVAGIYAVSIPKRTRRKGAVTVIFKSQSLDTRLEWPMVRWEIEVLRRSDGTKSLRQILNEGVVGVPRGEFSESLFLLYHFGVLNFFAPA